MPLVALEHIKRMRGGAQSHLMRCSDGRYYVVKFLNNPQHVRVLANEMIATRLAEHVGLPVSETGIVEVSDELIEQTPELHVQLAHNTLRCRSGLQFGSQYVVDPLKGQVFDYMPPEILPHVRNFETFTGMLALDKWTGNADGRQAAFWRLLRRRKYTAAFIDQGYCFNGAEWSFPCDPQRGVYAQNEVYSRVSEWNSFDPWLTAIESFSESKAWDIAGMVPSEWYEGDVAELTKLISTLLARRSEVRSFIETFRISVRRPFPRWLRAA